MSQSIPSPDVLTLAEVAGYLRLPEEMIERQAAHGEIPGRRIEDTWRFLKTAIDAWLSSQGSKIVLVQQAGVLADDDMLAALRDDIYVARERPETETAGDQ